MKYKSKYIDELIDMRRHARADRNWELSDEIRSYLDTQNIFIFDKLNAQIIYHRKKITRNEVINEIKSEQRAEKRFEAWLYAINSSIKSKSK